MRISPRAAKPRLVAKAKAETRPRDARIVWAVGFLFIAGLLWLAGMAQGAPAAPTAPALRELEHKVWTAEIRDFGATERQAVRILQESPNSAFAHYLIAHLYVRMFTNDPADLSILRRASELGQQAIDLDPRADYGYVVIAEILDLMGQPANGVRILEMAQAANVGRSWRTYFTRARLLSDTVAAEEALKLLDQAMAEDGSQRDVIAPYVVVLLQNEYQGAALTAAVNKWQAKFPNPLFEQTIAISIADSGEPEKAHAVYERVYQADPSFKEAMINDGILLYRELNRPKDAERLFTQVLAKGGADLNAAASSMVHGHLGALLLRQGKVAEAEQHFTTAVAKAENRFEMLDFINKHYRENHKPQEFANLIRHMNQEIPGSGLMHALLGETLSEDLQQHKDAIRAFSNAILLEPDRSDFYNGMGLAYYRMNDIPKALHMFSTATKVDPQDATARYNEACALARLGKSEQALGSLKEAISLDPRLQAQARSDADFASIKGLRQFESLTSEPAIVEAARPGGKLSH